MEFYETFFYINKEGHVILEGRAETNKEIEEGWHDIDSGFLYMYDCFDNTLRICVKHGKKDQWYVWNHTYTLGSHITDYVKKKVEKNCLWHCHHFDNSWKRQLETGHYVYVEQGVHYTLSGYRYDKWLKKEHAPIKRNIIFNEVTFYVSDGIWMAGWGRTNYEITPGANSYDFVAQYQIHGNLRIKTILGGKEQTVMGDEEFEHSLKKEMDRLRLSLSKDAIDRMSRANAPTLKWNRKNLEYEEGKAYFLCGLGAEK